MQNLMKTFFVLITVLGAVLAIAPAHAENGIGVLVDIPFDFSVGNAPLKAGHYKVEEVGSSGVFTLKGNDGQDHQFALTVPHESANRNHQPQLVFTRYGNEVFLDKVFLSGSDNCRQLVPNSREEKLIQKRTSGEEVSLLMQSAR